MFSCHTGFKIAVQAPLGGAPYVVVPDEQMDGVHRLFVETGIGHTVGNRPPEHNDQGVEHVIHIGRFVGFAADSRRARQRPTASNDTARTID